MGMGLRSNRANGQRLVASFPLRGLGLGVRVYAQELGEFPWRAFAS
jgi:hypothetical protein